MTDMWRSNRWRNATESPVFKLLSKRMNIVESDHPELLLYSCFGERFRSFRCRRVFYTGENRTPDPRDCDVSLSFMPTDDENYYLPLYKWRLRDHNIRPAHDLDQVISGKTRFCNFVYSNPGPRERQAFFAELGRRRRVDSGGRLHNNIGGPVADKLAFVSESRFTIAFENASSPGYTTEKLTDAYAGRTVPIYWGNPDIAALFNARAFINCHDFAGWESVADRVLEIDADPDLYRSYLAEPLFPGGRLPPSLEDDAVLDWLVPRVLDQSRPKARTILGLSRDTSHRVRLATANTARRAKRTQTKRAHE